MMRRHETKFWKIAGIAALALMGTVAAMMYPDMKRYIKIEMM